MGLGLGSSTVKSLFVGETSVLMVCIGSTKVWPEGLPAGTTYEFDYTGQVQSIELPPGRYKLECWGAQGGNTSSYNGKGSCGGYSEGILTLTETKTLYVFVGGAGSSSGNGGWNGGGSSTGYSSYSSGGEDGESWPACGGGATDIALVSSDMSYSSGRTNRSSESLLSRIIVAGGGAGASARYTEKETTTTDYSLIFSGDDNLKGHWTNSSSGNTYYFLVKEIDITAYAGKILKIDIVGSEDVALIEINVNDANNNGILSRSESNTAGTFTFTVPTNGVLLKLYVHNSVNVAIYPSSMSYSVYEQVSTTSSSTSSSYTTYGGEGGGTSGNGSYPGTCSSAGSGGGFGYGANQETTNYMYCGGAGGGGWYGGGTYRADGATGAIEYGSGGSGFVNTAANASYRPSGYTGLQLDSGSTTTGKNYGDGYAKITTLGDSDSGSGGGSASISWTTLTGTWNESSKSAAADGKSFTCVSPGDSGSTVIRCTFSGVTSITFNCVYNGESNYDYLTVGNIDSSCTRDSYGTTLKGTSGTAKDITFTCDTGTHYVEFCYSKDGSVSTSPDNATVYCKSYS